MANLYWMMDSQTKLLQATDNAPSVEVSTDSVIAYLETDTARPFVSRLLNHGISGLLAYETQTSSLESRPPQPSTSTVPMDCTFWEIFFHSSFLIANRFLNEQNYAESARWYQYIFAPTGFRDADGELEMLGGKVRYWNVAPLQQDPEWNDTVPPTVDPDVIAMNDPMHYKLAIFLNSVNRLIEQGDSAYRQLQRDYLAQAKMCYLQASQMLGPRPVINYTNSWPDPTLGARPRP